MHHASLHQSGTVLAPVVLSFLNQEDFSNPLLQRLYISPLVL
jgi:hypothetical protein